MWRQSEQETVCWDLSEGGIARLHRCRASDEPRLADWLLQEWTEIVVETPEGTRVS
ncbi:MAG: hypothetical protein NUW24_10820 [Anaerolineae bacterium]|jgi:hypothetical protein|nr:hypothetical protein [Anaerolineae bacterium]MDH7475076.1 hypothetical protein [Anaerolineae bacterium]